MAGLNTVSRGQFSNDSNAAARRKGATARQGAARNGRPARSGFEPLESRLLMSAVRPDAGFLTADLGLGDDRSFPTTGSAGFSLGFSAPINFFGSLYSGVFVNNNGNISLGARNSFYANGDMDAIGSRMIAPFYANVDTRFSGSTVRYGRSTVDGRAAFGVNWLNVDYYQSAATHTNKNSFQLVLIDRSDLGYGDFDIEFNYDKIHWESSLGTGGDANGLGGTSARVGWTGNNGDIASIFQMDGSGVAGSFLDSNAFTGLVHNSFMSDVDGRYVFRFRGGTWADAPGSGETNHEPVVTLPEGRELHESADGTASIGGLAGFFDDVDADTWTATVDYGDGTGAQVLELTDRGFVLDHTYTRPGLYLVNVTVDDGRGGVGTAMTSFAVQDYTVPVVDVLGARVVGEGQAVTLVASMAGDLDANDTYTFDWLGDGVPDGDTFSFATTDNGSHTVRLVVTDQHGNATTMDVGVDVVNLAPTAAGLSGADSLGEGGTLTLGLDGATDASADDLAAGLLYSFDFDGDGLFEVSGSSASASHLYDDNGLHLVRARVTDKDGGYTEYVKQVVVHNVAPTSSGLVGPAEGNEGAALSFNLGAALDPSAADAAGLTYSFDFNNDGVFDVVGASPSAVHTYDDNGRYTVRARVSDKDGGHTDYTTEVRVRNVPPRNGRFVDNNPIAEGSLVTVSFDGQDDPSAADTAAGFTYSFDFDNDGVYEVSGPSPSAAHAFGDNGVYTVRGKVTDKDGGSTEYATDVEVYNLAPTAAGLAGGSAVEGSALTLSLNGASDVAADMAAGLTYSFDLDNDGVFDVVGSSPSVSHTFAQDGTYTVTARVTDKDGGYSDHVATVTVANAAPVLGAFSTSAGTVGAAAEGSTVTVSGSFTDAGLLDTHTAVIDWGDGTTSAALLSEAGGAGTFSAGHVYAQGGVYTVRVRLADNASPAGQAGTDAKAYVTGVGLHNGVLQIVGTAGNDSVTLSTDNKGQLRVKSSLEKKDSFFTASTVREVRATLGAGNDSFSADADTTQPMYVNGVRYTPPSKGNGKGNAKTLSITQTVFSDRLVA